MLQLLMPLLLMPLLQLLLLPQLLMPDTPELLLPQHTLDTDMDMPQSPTLLWLPPQSLPLLKLPY